MRYRLKKIIKTVFPSIHKPELLKRFLKVIEEKYKRPLHCKEELTLKSISYKHPRIIYKYQAMGKIYTSYVDISTVDQRDLKRVDPVELNSVFLSIGVSLAPFHWLLCDFKSIRICDYSISKQERDFYENYLEKGLAEFRYRNGLNPIRKIRVFAKSIAKPVKNTQRHSAPKNNKPRTLVLNGGGKDSAVMLEMMKRRGAQVSVLSINPKSFQDDIICNSGIGNENTYKIHYSVDNSIAVDAKYSWGHMPYSALFISLSQIVALAKNITEVAVGNEQSSNEPNIFYKGVGINHQFSKSYEFEQGFNSITSEYLSRDIAFYSPLRTLTDISIAYIFSDVVDYKQSVVSCNIGGGKWCGKCAKCVFTFLSIAAFSSNKEIKSIFGSNFLLDKEARVELLNLLNKKNKPWECVGTYDETRLITIRYFNRNPSLEFNEWPKRSHIMRMCDRKTAEGLENQCLFKLHKPHNIPADLYSIIESELFKLKAMESTFKRCG